MVQKEQLKTVEYLFDQSANGFHVLFDNETIRRVLSSPTEDMDFFTFENTKKVQKILGDFLAKPSLEAKKSFLETLDEETHELLIRTYFNIVENSIFERNDLLKH